MNLFNKIRSKDMDQENTNPTPGEVVAPTGDTLNGANSPEQSAHDHEAAETAAAPVRTENTAVDGNSPVTSAHNELANQQGSLHEKIAILAERLKSVLATPFGGEQKARGDAKPTNGLSPVVANLEERTAQSQNTEHIVDHLLNNLEV
jgi:hypothetical protein